MSDGWGIRRVVKQRESRDSNRKRIDLFSKTQKKRTMTYTKEYNFKEYNNKIITEGYVQLAKRLRS